MASRSRPINLPAPYLRRVWLEPSRVADRAAYPFCLPFLGDDFELSFDRAITIIVGENGTGKSTLLEGIAVLAGYDEAGGGKGYRGVDHSRALEVGGSTLATALRAAWRPRITDGWFFKAETFFSIARYLDEAAREPLSGPPPDYLSHSHGEGFLRFFEERCRRQGIYFFDEPESALSRNHWSNSATSVLGRSAYPICSAISMTVWGRTPPSRWSCRSTFGAAMIVARSGPERGLGLGSGRGLTVSPLGGRGRG